MLHSVAENSPIRFGPRFSLFLLVSLFPSSSLHIENQIQSGARGIRLLLLASASSREPETHVEAIAILMAEETAYAGDAPVSPSSVAATAQQASSMTTLLQQATPRGPFRGKCLYKTGKCTNERALKTSGTAHNLCDEHRRRQNEHQRKLDTKNRYARKDKRGSGNASAKASSSANAPPSSGTAARYAPYDKSSRGSHATADHDSGSTAAAVKASADAALPQIAPVMAPQQSPGSSLHGLPAHAHTLNSLQHSQQHGDAGKVYLPNGAQPPQMAYPYMMQDFDGIVVPLPSYLEGHERIEFRARIYQKVLDFISEECIRRFGGKTLADGFSQAGGDQQQQRTVSSGTAPSPQPSGGYFAGQQSAYPSDASSSQQQQNTIGSTGRRATSSGSSTSSAASTPENVKRSNRTKEEVCEKHEDEEEAEDAASTDRVPEAEPETAQQAAATAMSEPQRPSTKKVREVSARERDREKSAFFVEN